MSGEPLAKKMKAIVKDPQHKKRIALSLQTFQVQSSFTDVCFVCAHGQKMFCHKLLLCSVSVFMKEMFMKLPDSLDVITVHLPDIEAHTLALLLDFLYEGSVRVTQTEYRCFEQVRDMLGIVLSTPQEGGSSSQAPPPQPAPAQAPAQQPVQPAQMVYLQQAPNTQGQMQYMVASQSPLVQGQMIQGHVMNPLPSSQPNTQMVQTGSQVMQQNNIVQMVQQSNGQVVPLNNQVVQCSNGQMMVQGNQQVMMRNQVVGSSYLPQQPQQQPQYVLASSANHMTTSQASGLYSRPQAVPQRTNTVRTQPSAQPQQQLRPSNNPVRARRSMSGAPLPMTHSRSVQRSRALQ